MRPTKEAFAEAWADDTLTRKDIAEKFGIGRSTARSLAIEFGLPMQRTFVAQAMATKDPTPEEIARMTAEIRKGWTDWQHEHRIRPKSRCAE